MIWWALAGCTPVISGMAVAPLAEGQRGEVGAAGHGGAIPVARRDALNVRQYLPTAGGTVYGRVEMPQGIGFGARMDMGPTEVLSTGAWLRYGIVRSRGSYAGIQLGGGALYGELSVPAAFRLGKGTWLYTRPAARVAQLPMGTLPVGLSAELGATWTVNLEGNAVVPILARGWARVNPVGLVGALGVSARY